MKHVVQALLVLIVGGTFANAQTPIYWKKDYIRDANGNAIAVATPAPSDTSAPSAPSGLAGTPSTTSIALSWTGLTGVGDLAGYVVYRGAVPIIAVGPTTTGFTDVGLTPSTAYSYRVVAFDTSYNYSNYSSAVSVSTNALSGSPTGLTATASSTSQINLSWSNPASGSPHHYGIWRKWQDNDWTKQTTTSSTSLSDTGLTSGKTYLYKVSAEDGSNTVLGWTNVDLATTITFTDDTITIGTTVVKAAHVTELRTAVNAVRVAAGLSEATWTNSSLSGAWIKAVDISEMRTALGDALNILGLPAPNYTDSTLINYSANPVLGVSIKKAHIEELRQRVK